MSDSEIRDDYAHILHHAGYDRLVAHERLTEMHASRALIQHNPEAMEGHEGAGATRSHAAPAGLEEALLLSET
jgi:hypothetical protein